MEIESVAWSTYNLSFDGIIEAWIVAGDMLAVVAVMMKVEAATEEDVERILNSMKK